MMAAIDPNFDLIPREIKNLPNWVLWRFEERDEKLTKVPHTPQNRKADSTDPHTWSAFETAKRAYDKGGFDGIGFVLTPPYVGTDCDKCLDEDGSITDEAKDVIDQLSTYSEISPSGKGIKAICKGRIPRGRKKGNFEMYQMARYFTITGQHYEGTPTTIEDRPEEVLAVYENLFGNDDNGGGINVDTTNASKLEYGDDHIIALASQAGNSDKFIRLMNGDTTGYTSNSEADSALCFLLAFYTKDQPQILRIVQRSKLWDEKWQRPDYQARTIGQALRLVEEKYREQPPTSELTIENLTKIVGQEQVLNPDGSANGEKRPKIVISIAKAAGAIIEHMDLCLSATDQLDKPKIWQYDNDIWKPNGEREVASDLYNIGGDLATERNVRETLNAIRAKLGGVEFDSDPFLFPLQDGVIDLLTGEFRYASAQDYLTFRYNAKYNCPEADYRPFLWFLCSSLPDPRDVITAIDITTAIALRIPFDAIVLLFGGGSNGKGIFEKVLLALFTLERSTALTLEELKRSRFGPGTLFDKDLWIVSEVETAKDATSALKKIATGELVDSDVKYGSRRLGRPHLMPILDANIAFDFHDDTYGRKRRIVKLDFPYTFGDLPEHRPRDPYLEDKLTKPEVLAGLAKIIIARAPHLIKTKTIYRRKSTEEQEQEYRKQQYHLNAFCEDCLSTIWPFPEAAPRLDVSKAYAEYEDYCLCFNVTTKASKVAFGRYISEVFGVDSKVDDKSKRYYPGLYLLKSAKTAYAEFKLEFTDKLQILHITTDKLQIEIDKNDISSVGTTDTTDKTLFCIALEIRNMYRYIFNCNNSSNLSEISYGSYLKKSVVSVVTVADSDLRDRCLADKDESIADKALDEAIDEFDFSKIPAIGAHPLKDLPTPTQPKNENENGDKMDDEFKERFKNYVKHSVNQSCEIRPNRILLGLKDLKGFKHQDVTVEAVCHELERLGCEQLPGSNRYKPPNKAKA